MADLILGVRGAQQKVKMNRSPNAITVTVTVSIHVFMVRFGQHVVVGGVELLLLALDSVRWSRRSSWLMAPRFC